MMSKPMLETPDMQPTLGIAQPARKASPAARCSQQMPTDLAAVPAPDATSGPDATAAPHHQSVPEGAVREGGPSRRKRTHAKHRYVLREELGRGGWGVVQRAVDRQLKRSVAIKQIASDRPLARQVRDAFLHEARITSQLQHPGIVPVHELDEGQRGTGEGAFYVMKLLEGRTLHDAIRDVHGSKRGPQSRQNSLRRSDLQPLLERLVDVCETVAYAHQQGILHRDLKPANVMVGEFGETIVVDWGLAKKLAEPTHRGDSPVNSPTIAGTPAYMAPEQAGGDRSPLTPAADVFALGVMLYEIVVGRHPHTGRELEDILDRVRRGVWHEEALRSGKAPRPLAAIIRRATAPAAADRYGSALEVAAEVRRYMRDEAVHADRESWLDAVIRWSRGHRTFTLTATAATLILLLASLVFGAQLHHAHQAEKAAHREALAAHQETLRRLNKNRRETDAWLTEIADSLRANPQFNPLRQKILERLQPDQARRPSMPDPQPIYQAPPSGT